MFVTVEYLEAALTLYSVEGSVLGCTDTLLKANYHNVLCQLVGSSLPKAEQVRMLASWDLPATVGSVTFPDAGLKQAKEALSLLVKGELLPERPFDGMIAKAIQSLRYQLHFSMLDFIVPIY